MNTINCEFCNKTYKTQNGLWKHNNKYHIDKLKLINDCVCYYCNKKLSDRHSKWRHEKICMNKNTHDINFIKSEFSNKILKLESELEIVKNKPATINNIKNINKGIINKGVINFIKPIGAENISVITEKEAENILEKEMNCLITLVDYINFNEKYPENHSFCTTALNDKYISTINTETLTIEKQRKKDFFDSMLNNSLKVINMLYDKLKNKNNPKAIKYKETIDNLTEFVVVNNKGKKAYVEMMNTLSFNKRHITQSTWTQLMKNEIPNKIDKSLNINNSNIIPTSEYTINLEISDLDDDILAKKSNIFIKSQIITSAYDSDSDSESEDVIEMKVQGITYLLDGINLYIMTETKEKGELFGTFINGKVKKIKKKFTL